jgi:hypothetical protein
MRISEVGSRKGVVSLALLAKDTYGVKPVLVKSVYGQLPAKKSTSRKKLENQKRKLMEGFEFEFRTAELRTSWSIQ